MESPDHPWHRIGGEIEVRLAPLDVLGCYDPDTGIIWIGKGLTQAERRSTLAHELVHAERGDVACLSDWHENKQERRVSEIAARSLIPLTRLVDALLWSMDESELADELWVDADTVKARLDTLTGGERAMIDARLWAREATA